MFENSSAVEEIAEEIAESLEKKDEHPNPDVLTNPPPFENTLQSGAEGAEEGPVGAVQSQDKAGVKASSELVFAGGEQ